MRGEVNVRTDPRASPTGYPFKIVAMDGVNSRAEGRTRCCDLGYLRTAYKEESGRLGYRCAAEPIDTYVKRGGTVEETEGRKCLCNGLFANIGQAQVRDGGVEEMPIVTSGDELASLGSFFRANPDYTAGDVIEHLLSLSPASVESVATNGNGASHNGHHANGHGIPTNGNGVAPGTHGVLVNGNGTNGSGPGVATPAPLQSRVIA